MVTEIIASLAVVAHIMSIRENTLEEQSASQHVFFQWDVQSKHADIFESFGTESVSQNSNTISDHFDEKGQLSKVSGYV